MNIGSGATRIVTLMLPFCLLCIPRSAIAFQDPVSTTHPPAGGVLVTGVVLDSSNTLALHGALVQLVPAASGGVPRSVKTDSAGRFRFDRVPPGSWLIGYLPSLGDSASQPSPVFQLPMAVPGERLELTLSLRGAVYSRPESWQQGETIRIRGVVQDSAGNPIVGASVTAHGAVRTVRADSSGAFVLLLPRGTPDTIELKALGFRSQRITVNAADSGTLVTQTRLERITPVLRAVTVTARRTIAGFHARRESGRGYYLDAEAIKKRRPTTVAEAMNGLAGVHMSQRRSFSSRIYVKEGRELCEPSVFADGREVLSGTGDLDAFVSVDDLEAIEIYRLAAEVPFEFHANPFCGAILIWRRSGR